MNSTALASLVFTFLFGDDSFDDIVGRLQLVTQTLAAGNDPSEETESSLTHKQMIELIVAAQRTFQEHSWL